MSADMRRYINFGGYGIRAAQSRHFYSSPPNCEAQQNLTELIIQDFAVDASSKVFSGDYVAIRPHKCMSHDNTWPIVQKFQNIGVKKVFDPKQLVYTLDHDVQNRSETNIKKYTNIEKFAKQQNVDFYPAGRGIGHQIMIEEGYALPMTFTVASDSHSNMYGGIGCLGTPIVRTDAASIWATGQTWWQIPPVAKVNLTGQLPLGVTGKDLIITLCGLFNNDEVLNHAIEFTGPGVSRMEIDDRLTIANMTTEWGALSGLFPVDEKLLNWYLARIKRFGENHLRINYDLIRKLERTVANPFDTSNAKYAKVLNLNLSDLVPNVAGPNSVKITASVDKLEPQKIKINKAYLVSCTNSRLSDLKAAAKVLQNKTINPTVQFFLAAASCEVQKDAEECGAWDTLIKAGCTPLPAGCGPCIGLGTGLLEDGEVGISATNRNFKGRMGSRNALAYLASPAVVAASALEGYICGPKDSMNEARHSTIEYSIENKNMVSKDGISNNTKMTTTTATAILKGFPEQISGQILFCDYDNMNTDGIYPGKYTYQDDVSRDQMSRVVMENYDKSFSAIAKEGDVLVSGFNFGCGSSREQAATALLSKNIPLVIAGSFSDIFKRNSINNGLLCIEAPALIHKLRAATESQKLSKGLTVRTGWQVEWDIARNTLKITTDNELDSFKIDTGSLGVSVQELYLYGGIENWIKAKSQAI